MRYKRKKRTQKKKFKQRLNKKKKTKRRTSMFDEVEEKQLQTANNYYGLSKRPVLGTRYKCKLLYAERGFTLNPGAGGLPVWQVFSANGLYDPNITGIGHQPLGFDQIMEFYNHYTVIGSKCTITCLNNDTTYMQYVGIRKASSPTTITSVTDTVENGNVNFAVVAPAGTGSNASTTLSMNMSPGAYLSKSSVLSEDDLRGNASNNPAEQCYFHVFAAPTAAVDSGSVSMIVTIEYIAVFTEPKNTISS